MKREGGIGLLNDSDREACQSFFDKLADYGVFVVHTGEVESWLTNLSVGRGKSTWLDTIFEAMGEDPSMANYVRPSGGDVWDFVGKVSTWVTNPRRKGVPD